MKRQSLLATWSWYSGEPYSAIPFYLPSNIRIRKLGWWQRGMSSKTLRFGVFFFSKQMHRFDYTIAGPAMFCTSMLTRRASPGITGTMENSISSRLSWIPLQALPLYDLRMMMIPSVSTIKASDHIPWVKDPLNNYLNIDPNTNFIRMVYQCNPTNRWKEAPPIAKAVKGSSFAIVRSPDSDLNKIVSRIYYQDAELCLREHCYNHSRYTDQWVPGE